MLMTGTSGPSASNITEISTQTRSCQKCNQRKTRCSKTRPCTSCVKLGIECIFPPPGRAPRRKKRALKAELVSKVKSLEQKVRELEDERNSPQSDPGVHEEPSSIESNARPSVARTQQASRPPVLARDELEGRFGKLVVEEGSSRYVSHEALASFRTEYGKISTQSKPGASASSEPHDLRSSEGNNSNSFLFGYRALAHSLRDLYPTPLASQALWAAYEKNVAPLILILHKPTIRNLVRKAATNGEFLDATSDALVFAVYFAAVMSMKPDECQVQLGVDRQYAIQHYRFAAEQALSRADFLHARCLSVLQAAVLFLIVAWRCDDVRFVWAMTALVYRLAQGLGLHRDGEKLGLGPFETEIRRRLWWYIYLLDSQTSEHQAMSPQIYEGTYDTEFPLNINDDDLSPEATDRFKGRDGFTEMTFCLIRCEINVRYRRILKGSMPGLGPTRRSVEDITHALTDMSTFIENKRLQLCDLSVPIQWVAATVTRIALARSWLVAHLSLIGSDDLSSDLWQQRRELLFQTAIEVLEFTHLLESSDETAHWSWMFEMYRQWHAFAFVLSELCVRPSQETDRAWMIANLMFQRWQQDGPPQGWVLWKPLSRLMQRVTVKRAGEIVTDRANK
ncbi:C6 transcription factor [Penicillium cataractarum]|uniref:C6 transcription factor n=1 Tax=Penicillium cataractarum TaxID=2100454 RepID=A0A9W9V9J7_9EURO|nr:C6 transcription factor [Penicillium cataractarum]KAJ5371410.1 C6 transcription factor [Penicillium cataractarum]